MIESNQEIKMNLKQRCFRFFYFIKTHWNFLLINLDFI